MLFVAGQLNFCQEGDQIHIGKEVIDRIKNIGKSELEIIEAQREDIISENDIVRVDDDFGRDYKTSKYQQTVLDVL